MDFNSLVAFCDQHQGFVIAVLTFVYVATTIVLAGIVVRASSLARKQLMLAMESEHNRIRPYIVFDLITEDACIFAVLKNTGLTPAHGVKITVTPSLKSIEARGSQFEIPFLVHGVPMMPPNREIKALVEHWGPFLKKYEALRFEGKVSYSTRDDSHHYDEAFVIDLNSEKHIVRIGKKDLNDLGNYIQEIAGTLRSLADGWYKPLVRTIPESDHQAQAEEQVRLTREAIRQANEKEPGSTLHS